MNSYLKDIKEFHLTKLLSKVNRNEEEEYSSYAQTLEGYFMVMTEIEQGRF